MAFGGGYLNTGFTGTILATGKTFTHGLGTTPDIVYVMPQTGSLGSGVPYGVLTFNSQICTICGPADGAAVTILVQKLHSIIG